MACNLHGKYFLISEVQTAALTVLVIRYTNVLQFFFHGGTTKIIFSISRNHPTEKNFTAVRKVQLLWNYCQKYLFLREILRRFPFFESILVILCGTYEY
jgi:hypothetical protein